MDTVTQITLGASVGEAIAGRQAGTKAPIWGGVLGVLPDLDVLANPFLTEVQSLTFHRSVTHSLVFAVIATFCAAAGLRRLHSETKVSTGQWAVLAAVALFTHIGLDCLTTYGTQIFWPFSRYPVILGTIFVIDPLYTIPLATGLLLSLRWPPTAQPRRWLNYAGLGLSSVYLLITVANKIHVERTFQKALAQQDLPTKRVLTRPTPLNNLLWTGIAEGDSGYYVGLYSLLDEDRGIDFRYIPKRHGLLGDAKNSPPLQRLRHFSRGYFIVRRRADSSLLVHDLRFGQNNLGLTSDGHYLFTFRLVRNREGAVAGLRQVEPALRFNNRLLRRFWARIWGQTEEQTSSKRSGVQLQRNSPPFTSTSR